MITQLGLNIDTRPLVQGAKALDDFARSAKPAQTAATALEKAVNDAGNSTGALGAKIKPATSALEDLSRAAKPVQVATTALEKATTDLGKSTGALGGKIKPTNDALTTVTRSGALARHEMINLSRQMQDVGVSLAGGMSPFTVLAQQGSQVFDIFSSSKTATVGGALKQIGGGIASVLTPTRLLVGGLGAVALGGVAVANALGKSALAAADLARITGTNIGSVRGFQTAANYKGIGDEESSKAMAQFARNVYDAKNNMGGLADVFRANNVQAKDFNSALDAASTLIRRAKGDTQLQFQLLESMGLPATMKWVKLLEQGGDALRKAINVNLGNPDAENRLAAAAQKFDDAWNKATTNASNYIKSWGLSAWSALDSVWTKVADGAGNFTRALAGVPEPEKPRFRVRITGGTMLPPEKTPVDPAAVQRALSLEQQRLGILGQVATVNETVRAQELAIQQARLSGANVSAADAKRILENTKANALGTAQIRAQTDAINVENATLGMTTGNALAYASVQQRINEEKRKGNVLGADEIARLRTEATALGNAAQNAENMRFAYEELVRGPMQTLRSSIASGASFFDALKKSGVSALDALSSKLMDMAAQNLWQSAFGGKSGGAGSFFSNLFGSGGNTSGALNANGSINGAVGPTSVGGLPLIGANANGTDNWRGGLTRINEEGGEILNLPRGTQIIPHDVSMAMANRIRVPAAPQFQSVGSAPITVTVPISIDATGADAAGLQRVQQQLASLEKNLPARIVAESRKAQTQRRL